MVQLGCVDMVGTVEGKVVNKSEEGKGRGDVLWTESSSQEREV